MDRLLLPIVALFAIALAFLLVDFSLPPAEDAAMLMRYAQHVAGGHGIVWNIGEPPVDGATDFLFMVAVAAIVKVGASVEVATRALILVAHVLTVCIVFLAVRCIGRAPLAAAVASAVYLIFGPANAYISTYFGAPVFAACAAAAWACALAMMNDHSSRPWAAAFATASLLTGLVRPEGVILAALMLLAIVVNIGIRQSRTAIMWFVAIFATLGLAYFLWRWNYFGHPLPNPFYKKGGGTLHFAGLKDSIYNTLKFTLPLLPLFAAGLFSRETRRATLSVSIPIIGFASCFILVSNEMNFAGRFQYALLPMALMAWPIPMRKALNSAQDYFARRRYVIAWIVVVYSLCAIAFLQAFRDDWAHHPDGRAAVGKMLREYKEKNLKLATSEAGLLPLYSKWKTLDTWGLNDFTIASQGIITPDYLAAFDPDLIVFHAYDPSYFSGSTGLPGWSDMVQVLRAYVAKHKFGLIAAFGETPEDVHYYYVHPRVEQIDELRTQMKRIHYAWPENGNIATNYS